MGCFPSKSSENDNVENQANISSDTQHRVFSVDELVAATNSFSNDCILENGIGRFGPVYKGTLKCPDEIVAIKKIDYLQGQQSCEAFSTEARMLVKLRHPNLIRTIGFTADGIYRYLVFEYMPLGSLDECLFNHNSKMPPLDWKARMKIALCIARGLEYLHLRQDPPIIHGNLKCSNILLHHDYEAKLSVFGMAKEGVGHEPHDSTSAGGSSRYNVPEYARTGRLTVKSDIHGLGAVLLEILTGRRFGEFNNGEVQDFAAAARPRIGEEDFLMDITDPLLEGNFPRHEFVRAASLMVRCVQAHPDGRPQIHEVVNELSQLPNLPETNLTASDTVKDIMKEIWDISKIWFCR